MENSVAVLKQTELLGQQFTVYGTANEPLFLAKDIASIIEHSDVSTMMRSIDEDEKLIQTIFVSGQNREAWMLTESGLYEVLMQSRKPIAKQFKKVVKAILKEIRTTGGYLVTLQETGSPKSALFYFNTDSKTTATQFATLLTDAHG